MESAAVIRSFHHSAGTNSLTKSVLEMAGIIPMNNVSFSNVTKLSLKGFANGARLVSSSNKHGRMMLLRAKASETAVPDNSDGAVLADSHQKVPIERSPQPTATFPKGFETLITEVCDSTEVAELKLKVGDFEMHLKRKIEAPTVVSPPPPPPPSPSTTSIASPAAAPAPSPGKSSSEKLSPFTNVAAEKSAKLAALEASGASGYVLVASPTVGTFQKARTLKGKKQPPACKEGDVIKEGQTIGFVDQFGTELMVKSDVAGEVLKVLCQDGDAVGYGDPVIAVLPSFKGIN